MVCKIYLNVSVLKIYKLLSVPEIVDVLRVVEEMPSAKDHSTYTWFKLTTEILKSSSFYLFNTFFQV